MLGGCKVIWDFGIPVIWNWDLGFDPFVKLGFSKSKCEIGILAILKLEIGIIENKSRLLHSVENRLVQHNFF